MADVLCNWSANSSLTGTLYLEYRIAMASRTGKTRMARKIRKARKGKRRKRAQQNKGTTPKFSIHTD
jgi:hypothetical protein